jgi:uncharacterized protein YgbK (DUF1537 family)
MYTIENKLGYHLMPLEVASPRRTVPPIGSAGAKRVRILADDLTGACDAGAAFLRTGRSVRVWLGANALFSAPETVQAFHTASRSLAPDEAADAVARAVSALQSDAGALFFKKIDSAGRGPIAAELLAAHRELGTRGILLAPAFPATGRTVRDGVLEIQDSRGQIARVSLTDLFSLEKRSRIALLKDASQIAAAMESGKTVLIMDSSTQQELNAIADAAEHFQELMYAGSAGLAQAIATQHAAPDVSEAPAAAAERILVIAGTPHPVTKLQLEALESAGHGRERLRILRIECEHGDNAKIRDAFASFDPEALILTGGDTAQLAAHALDARSILLHGEFAPGIPWGRLQGGLVEGRIAVTKSGGFGVFSSLNDVVAKLSGAS